MLQYCRHPDYRRTIRHLLNRGETRNSPARDVFHGHRGQLRRHYQVGQENQLDTLGIMLNIIVLWQAVYTQAALDHLAANGHHPDPADAARSHRFTYSTTHGRQVLASTALTTRSQRTLSKNFWMSRSITQSVFQQRLRHVSTACSADLPGR